MRVRPELPIPQQLGGCAEIRIAAVMNGMKPGFPSLFSLLNAASIRLNLDSKTFARPIN